MIAIYEPEVTKYSDSAIKAIKSGWISNHGEYVVKSTQKIKEILNSKYAILMANGTCATHCLFLSIKFKYPEIKKIYVPNNAYIAAWNSALMEYDIGQLEVMKMNVNTWNICCQEEYLKTLDANSAVLIVHNLGNVINVPELKKIRPDLVFVEDNCEGLFGKYNGIYSGTSDDILCSSASFYGNKIITTGEGGLFLTQHQDVYDYIKKIYSQGMSDTRYLHDVHAYNYRMTNIEAAFLYDQLFDINNILERKKQIFTNYQDLFGTFIQSGKVKLFEKENHTEPANWIFAIRILEKTKSIDETHKYFTEVGVDIRPFFYPINKHNHLSTIKNDDSCSEILNKEIIMIPSSPEITIEQQQKVVQTIFDFVLLNQNIQVIQITTENKELLDNFIPNINSDHFRYYNNRTSDVIKDHILTLLFYDTIKNKYFGYTHIDFCEQYWFGIYLDPDYRGKKLGDLLCKYTLSNKKLNYIGEVSLSVDNNNSSAVKLYLNNGFEEYKISESTIYMKKSMPIR